MIIRTASQQIPVQTHGGYRSFVQHCLDIRWSEAARRNSALRHILWEAPAGEVKAEVARSDWRAGCPFCPSFIVAEPGEPFFCPDCAMQGNDFKPMTVVFPEARAEIEQILAARQDPMTRNWTNETVTELQAENAAHGEEIKG